MKKFLFKSFLYVAPMELEIIAGFEDATKNGFWFGMLKKYEILISVNF